MVDFIITHYGKGVVPMEYEKKNVLVYVDAENLSAETIRKSVRQVKSEMSPEDHFVGKFYGGVNVLGGNLNVCLECGLDFVETSSLNLGYKNVTDMKLVVDCISDVQKDYYGTVKRVVILSHDVDFTPLVYKLRSNDINTEIPLQELKKRKTIGELGKELYTCGYFPTAGSTVDSFECVYDNIRKCADKEFSDDLIEKFVKKKIHKFVSAARIAGLLNEALCIEFLQSDARKFNFRQVLSARAWNYDSLREITKIFASKFFGYIYTEEKLTDVLSTVEVKSVS